MSDESRAWVLLAYRLPREPSTPRIALWRRLRRLGAVQLLDGLVALPNRAEAREQFDWLADEIVEAGGDATIWLADAATAGQARALADRMREAAAADYAAVSAAAHGDRRTLRRLRRALQAIRSRDYFSPPEREEAEAAVEALAVRLEVVA